MSRDQRPATAHRLLVPATPLVGPGAGSVGHAGFSTCGPWASGCGSRALERRRSSFGAGAQLPRGTWDLPGSGIELCLLCWQKDAFPLSHPRSPIIVSLQRSA